MNVLQKMGLDLDTVRAVDEQVGLGPEAKPSECSLPPRVKKVLALAGKSEELNHSYVGTEHILGALREGEGVAARVLECWMSMPIDAEMKFFLSWTQFSSSEKTESW